MKTVQEKSSPVRAIFLHVQKTAGSSLLEAVCREYGNDLIRYGDYWGHQPEEFSGISFVSGHFGYQYASSLMRGRFSFTFLRDPVERIISLYYFCKGRDPNQFLIYRRAQELDFRGFLEAGLDEPMIKMHIWNNQVWQLAYGYYGPCDKTVSGDFSEETLLEMAKEHLHEFSFVGLTENLNQDGRDVLEALNISPITTFPKINVTNNRPQATDVTEYEQTLLDELTGLDKHLYNYAREMKLTMRENAASLI